MVRRERMSGLKDKVQANRTMVVYVLLILAGVLALVGWVLLPDVVSMAPELEDAAFHPKERLLALYFAMTALFSGLLWKWPRELAYLTAAILSILMPLGLLYANLGV